MLGWRVVGIMFGKRNCSVNSCSDAAVASLVQQDLCLNHFLCRCYENLERLEPIGARIEYHPADLESRKAFVEECSREALRVGLHGADLCNLQRGRLLDILLWAGDLFVALRTRIVAPASPSPEPRNGASAREQTYYDDQVQRVHWDLTARASGADLGGAIKRQAARAC